jgi:cysteine desulfurase
VNRPIYLDNHATTQVDPRVADVVMRTMLVEYGNANSREHAFGVDAANLIENARSEVGRLVGADERFVHFTSGSSNSIDLAIEHALASRHHDSQPLRVAASRVEHRAMLDALDRARFAGSATVKWIPVDGCARLDLEEVRRSCESGVDLLVAMAANNEVGTIYPIGEIARIATENGASLLVDATQAAGRTRLRFSDWSISYLALSAHKIYGPKGVGALVTTADNLRNSHGDIQGVGTGTPNVPGIAGLAEACRLRRHEMATDEPRIATLRDRLQSRLLRTGGVVVNGDQSSRLAGNLHISVCGVPNDAIIARLRRQVAISTGAACSSGALASSHVLLAMGLSEIEREGALRIGLGRFTTEKDVSLASDFIADAIAKTRESLQA